MVVNYVLEYNEASGTWHVAYLQEHMGSAK